MTLAGRARSLVLLALLGLAGCGLFRADEGFAPELEPSGPRVVYEVVIEGDDLDPGLESFLLAASEAAGLEERPPASEVVLRRRAEADLPRLKQALRSRGYYRGEIDYEIRHVRDPSDEAEEGAAARGLAWLGGLFGGGVVADTLTGGAPTRLVYRVEPGPQFAIEERIITIEGEDHGYTPPPTREIGLREGEPALAARVLDAEQQLVRHAREAGFAFAEAGDRRIVIDHDTNTMDVELVLRLGEPVRFDQPTFSGIEGISANFVERRVLIEEGDPYAPSRIERARRRLIDSNLFSTIRVIEGDTTDETGHLPVEFEVRQRQHRTVGAGVGFRSDDGPNVRAFWEHRNFLGAGERMRVEGEASPLLRELRGRFRKPDLVIEQLDLIADGSLRIEDTEGFSSQSISAGAGLERRFSPNFRGSLGVAYRFAEISENGDEEIFGLFSVPASLAWDFSDSQLDPTEGWRLSVSAAPFWDTLGLGTRFLKSDATHTRYWQVWREPRLVLALRGRLGSIVGVDRADVPADVRFFAGGGGSVRGIPFQLAGPLDDNDDPVGGRSLLEGSAEVRYAAFGNIELVTFLDAGTVFRSPLPAFDEGMQFGTGLGLRYATPIGPIRFDVGVPVDKRDGIDDAFQFYVSIGQAF